MKVQGLAFITTVLGVVSSVQAQRRTTTTTTRRTTTTTARTTVRTTTVPTAVVTSASTVSSSTVSSSTASPTASTNGTAAVNAAVFNGNVDATILVIAKDAYGIQVASSGLNGYGIPFQPLQVPQAGVALPALNSSSGGNFGGIIIAGQVSYDYGAGNFSSALTSAQWQLMYDYQTQYGVRMVQYDVYPGPAFGASALGGCCDTGVEQLMYFSNVGSIPFSGLKTGSAAGVSTQGLWHYPSTITDTNTTTELAKFAAAGSFQESTAAVINNFSGRQQMVFFISWATDWNPASNFLQHAYIAWMTRGLYAGHRRVNLNTQIDDMMLGTDIYNGLGQPTAPAYRVNSADMADVANWVSTIQGKMPTGSFYLPEIGYNGNGAIEAASAVNAANCAGGPVYTEERADTDLEFVKPLGTGSNAWPTTPTTYGYSSTCVKQDALWVWFNKAANRDKFMHLSHTYTHYELNNATYADTLKEIQFNQAWLQQIGFPNGRFSANALIPPAITGLHNGDALRAWSDAGLRNCVGDNTRPKLRNAQNQMWPYKTTTAADGFDGFNVIPRWATRIYYNCDSANCTTREWLETSAGVGDFTALLNEERKDTMRHLFGLYHDG